MSPTKLNPVPLGGRIVEHEAELFGRQMWPEFIVFKNPFNDFVPKPSSLCSNELETKGAQRYFLFRPLQRFSRRFNDG